MNRIINSFIPSWHSPLLSHPDIYGPLIAVFCLPQTLLLAMETSKHGCNPTSQLGNTVVVSLTIWLGLSFLYRIVSYIVAPTIQFKHCLSVVGYSFFSWNLAILCYLPLEKYKNHIDIPSLLPLVLIGIPASIAQVWLILNSLIFLLILSISIFLRVICSGNILLHQLFDYNPRLYLLVYNNVQQIIIDAFKIFFGLYRRLSSLYSLLVLLSPLISILIQILLITSHFYRNTLSILMVYRPSLFTWSKTTLPTECFNETI